MARNKKKGSQKGNYFTSMDLDSDDELNADQESSPVFTTPERLSRRKKKSKRGGKKSIRIEDYYDEFDDLDVDIDEVADVAQTAADRTTGQLVEKMFDTEDQEDLCENEHKRFMNPSLRIGSALVGKGKDGGLIAWQFKAPGTSNPDAPQIIKLKNIELVKKYGALRARAETEDGTKMISVRSLDMQIDTEGDYAQNAKLFFFSPEINHQFEGRSGKTITWWGEDETRQPPLFRELDEEEQAELDEELAEIKKKTKGGKVTLVHEDVPVRDDMKRNPQQNQVMGGSKCSAINAYADFYDEREDELSDQMKAILRKSIAARPHYRGGGPKTQPRPEWLHAIGFGLTPLDMNPQVKGNLGAAPKWLNTKMMTTERALKWHALHRPDSELTLETRYEMLLDTDLIKRGFIEGTFEENGNTVKMRQDLNPFVKNPNYPKPTDICQATMATHYLLHEKDATSSKVKKGEGFGEKDGLFADYVPVKKSKQEKQQKQKRAVKASSIPRKEQEMARTKKNNKSTKAKLVIDSDDELLSDDELYFEESVEQKAEKEVRKPRRSSRLSRQEQDSPSDDELDLTPVLEPKRSSKKVRFEEEEAPVKVSRKASRRKQKVEQAVVAQESEMPNAHPLERSVIKFYSTFHEEDYQSPWKGTEPLSCTGSGFVIEKGGKYYVLTNAHVVENSAYLQVRRANDDKMYPAKPLQVSYQSDIAIVEVDDPEFLAKVEPVEFGEMAKVRDKMSVVGFPMGGEELSTTEGIISRIQVDDYVVGLERNLQVQTDSAINPGNSGGPVFKDNKLIGIAFQGLDGGDGLGYIIPIPVVEHFLEDYFSPGAFKGYPTLNIACQPLMNESLRDYHGLSKEQSGLLVTKIDDRSDAKDILQKDDIILAIDGINISNDGKAKIPGIGSRIEFNYLFSQKQIGEVVNIDVLRFDEDKGRKVVKSLEVQLNHRPAETKLVGPLEFEKPPTYLVESGILFQPITANYLMTSQGKPLREMIHPQFGYIDEVPKRSDDQQLIVINTIFNSDITRGYEFYENSIVKEVNGKVVNNMHELAEALDGNKGKFHCIKVSDGEKIVVKNLSYAENLALVKPYRVPELHSADLKRNALQQAVQQKYAESDEEDVHLFERTSIKARFAKQLLAELGIDPSVVDQMRHLKDGKSVPDLRKLKGEYHAGHGQFEFDEEEDGDDLELLASEDELELEGADDEKYEGDFIDNGPLKVYKDMEVSKDAKAYDREDAPPLMFSRSKAQGQFGNVVNNLFNAANQGLLDKYDEDDSFVASDDDVLDLSSSSEESPQPQRRRLKKRA